MTRLELMLRLLASGNSIEIEAANLITDLRHQLTAEQITHAMLQEDYQHKSKMLAITEADLYACKELCSNLGSELAAINKGVPELLQELEKNQDYIQEITNELDLYKQLLPLMNKSLEQALNRIDFLKTKLNERKL